MFDEAKTMAAEVVRAMREHIRATFAPLDERLQSVEKAISERPVPKDGKDADPEVMRAAIDAKVTEQVDTRFEAFAKRVTQGLDTP